MADEIYAREDELAATLVRREARRGWWAREYVGFDEPIAREELEARRSKW